MKDLAKVLTHALNVIEDRTPLGWRVRLSCTIPGHRYRELHSRIPRVIVDNVQFSLRICVVQASFQSVKEVFVKELQLNRDGYPLTQSRTF